MDDPEAIAAIERVTRVKDRLIPSSAPPKDDCFDRLTKCFVRWFGNVDRMEDQTRFPDARML